MTKSTITALRLAADANAYGDSATGDLLREAADALEQFQWRDIAELVMDGREVLLSDGNYVVARETLWDNWIGSVPTHYMPLPPPPKRGEP